ncbi:MAG: helix-turn-helix domain-containing protein [Pseudomonadota bacterium]
MIEMRHASRRDHKARRIAFLAFPQVVPLDLFGPWGAFAAANRLAEGEAPPYALELLSGAGTRDIVSCGGVPLRCHRRASDCEGDIDTLLVPAADVAEVKCPGEHTAFDMIRRLSARARRTVSVCGGAFLLAGAGLLDGRRVTTHWRAAADLSRQFPKVHVDADAIFVKDGSIYTSAGVTAGIDLALALVAEDEGPTLALECARDLVVFMRRPGGQSQFSATLKAQHTERSPINELVSWATDNPAGDLSVEAMAKRIHMSTRNFSRVFRREVDQTPAAFVEKLRVDAVRRCLEETDTPLETISEQCGFNSTDVMRRAFQRVMKIAPADYRRRFPGSDRSEPAPKKWANSVCQ